MFKAATDYHQKIIAVKPLPGHPYSKDYTVDYYVEGESRAREGGERKLFTITVDRLDDLPIRHLNFIKNLQHPDLPNDFNLEVYVEAFNILLGRKTSQDAQIQQAGSFSFFDKENLWSTPEEYWTRAGSFHRIYAKCQGVTWETTGVREQYSVCFLLFQPSRESTHLSKPSGSYDRESSHQNVV
jgi:hypothetical protein